MRFPILLVLTAAALPLVGQTKLPPPHSGKVDFQKDVLPILAQKCHSCHGDGAQQAGLRLDRRQAAMRGGDYGPVILPGKSADSKLIRRLVNGDGGMQMPPTGALADEEIGILRAWIDQGADFRLDLKEDAPPQPVDPQVSALLSAVRSGDTRLVSRMLRMDPGRIKAVDAAGSTPLHHAAAFAPLSMVQLLLDKGADVNAVNRRKSTPLHWGIHDEAKVRLLLDKGASLNVRQAAGRTPLYLAATLGNGDPIVHLLLAKGADPNLATANGQTPLMVAATRGSRGTMLALLEKGAKVDVRNGGGGTALMAAAASGEPNAVQLLLDKGADANAATKRNETALAAAATTGVAESVRLLLDRGAKVNVRDDRGYSPLMYAAGSDTLSAAVVQLLLDKGADPAVVGEGETAKMLAAKRGDTEVARLLGVSEADRKRGGVAAAAAAPLAKPVIDRSLADSVTTALALLEKQSHNFIRIGGCNSCHSQDLPSAAAGLARDRSIPAPKAIAQLPLSMTGNSAERVIDMESFSVGSLSWELFDLGMNHAPADHYTDAVTRYIKAMQTAEGNWQFAESRRPPMNTGVYQTAALAIYALRHYGPVAEKADTDKAIARAAAWLAQAKPKPTSTQDRAFRLMGLSWANGSAAAIKEALQELTATQRADGGWSQMPSMGSDAYATGQALYALSAGAMPATHAVYQKGIGYLRNTQAADGSWHVKTRSIWIQPYFESGFPYGHDQWISAAGTAWAAMAVSMAVETPRLSRNVTAR